VRGWVLVLDRLGGVLFCTKYLVYEVLLGAWVGNVPSYRSSCGAEIPYGQMDEGGWIIVNRQRGDVVDNGVNLFMNYPIWTRKNDEKKKTMIFQY
jgi:hypothetical protein